MKNLNVIFAIVVVVFANSANAAGVVDVARLVSAAVGVTRLANSVSDTSGPSGTAAGAIIINQGIDLDRFTAKDSAVQLNQIQMTDLTAGWVQLEQRVDLDRVTANGSVLEINSVALSGSKVGYVSIEQSADLTGMDVVNSTFSANVVNVR